jgi:septal ring-binding cell division protein DamX
MDEKTKLYVFSKKEVALIFLFMVVTAITSFVVGVKMGKSFSYAEAGLKQEDRQMVEILSGQEEMVNEVVDKQENNEEENVSIKDLNQRLEEKLIDELSGRSKKISDEQMQKVLEKKNVELKKNQEDQVSDSAVSDTKAKTVVPPVMDMAAEKPQMELEKVSDQYKGKFTIQLGSHRSLREAEEFAEGFKVRGYNPIINEVELPNRGTWFRVSLGAFASLSEAKEYVKKEYSLFQGQDYVFVRFD